MNVYVHFSKKVSHFLYTKNLFVGEDENLKEALNLILQKVVEDPQSGRIFVFFLQFISTTKIILISNNRKILLFLLNYIYNTQNFCYTCIA